MGVARHLRIELDEYDARIRTFVPHYETMIAVIAGGLDLLAGPAPAVVDLGIGTGALAEACFRVRTDLRLVGLDVDPGMIEAAKQRLRDRPAVEIHELDFVAGALPRTDVFVACISLHHIRTPAAKREFYERVHAALSPGGLLLNGDCFPGTAPALAHRHREAWLAHLERTYTRAEAEAYLEAWAAEDVYFPLEAETEWLRDAGFRPDVLWRQDGFAVLAAIAHVPDTGGTGPRSSA